MAIYSYIIPRDYGFAPNPFYGVCSLATCKPRIRKHAGVGDWIIGFGSAADAFKEKMIYAMRVDDKITFDEYWKMDEYQCKKPVMNGSLKQKYGDNIYHREADKWKQADSHHSLDSGEVNIHNLRKDTSTDAVLLSTHFWYFGKSAINVPKELQKLIHKGIGHSKHTVLEIQLQSWLESLSEGGVIDEPAMFSTEFKRYDGKS